MAAGREERMARFDRDLNIEAYQFVGLRQKFPNHFHQYYVIGVVGEGRRFLRHKNTAYTINSGDLILFNPLENHACAQIDNKTLDWRCLNISEEVMGKIALKITGHASKPQFTKPVARQSKAVTPLRELHALIMGNGKSADKERILAQLIGQLMRDYTEPGRENLAAASEKIQKACAYMENNPAALIRLDDLSELSGLNKYTLLRKFTSQRGLTPYQYLETVRIGAAKKLLEKGVPPALAAIETGFADQSHFTKFFKKLIGLTPGQYGKVFKERDRGKSEMCHDN